MPSENALAVLSLCLVDEKGSVISRNFTTFDVRAEWGGNLVDIPVCSGKPEGFSITWNALLNDKLCMGGKGEVSYEVALPACEKPASEMILHFEASSKRVLNKDRKIIGDPEVDGSFMRGYLVDRGSFENSYWMTDDSRFPSSVDVLVNGVSVQTISLENDWADARGVLSWLRQPNHRKLDEAGSYGESKRVLIPSNLIPAIQQAGKLTVTFRVLNDGGLALYGRECGRYAHGLMLELK